MSEAEVIVQNSAYEKPLSQP